jgi:hypothetical protein
MSEREIKDFGRETAPSSAASERVLERALGGSPGPEYAGSLIREIPAAWPGAEERVLRRALAGRPRAAGAGWLWAPALVGAAALLALLALPGRGPSEDELLAASGAEVPAPGALEGGAPEAAPLQGRLDASAQATWDGTPGVRLVYTGAGEIGGTAQAPRLQWRRGSLRVEVDPAEHLALEVHTEEGRVRVLGTIFTVERDALGTRVSVERGHVAVDCAGGASSELTAGGAGECLPATAPGLLGRARHLLEAGAPTALVIDALDRGQALAGPETFDGRELQALRVRALLQAGDTPGACAAAATYPGVRGGGDDARVAELAALLDSAWCEAPR